MLTRVVTAEAVRNKETQITLNAEPKEYAN